MLSSEGCLHESMEETENKGPDIHGQENGKASFLRGETSKTPSLTPAPPRSGGPAVAFAFWGYLTVAVSLLTLLLVSFPPIDRSDETSWFLGLPDALHRHYSSGKFVKVQPPGGEAPIQVFVVDLGPRNAETVLLVHGLGCSSYSFRRVLHSLAATGFRAIAVDLPGFGFSDEASSAENPGWGGPLGWIWSICAEIKEKGLFWGFDELIETGEIHEKPARVSVEDRLAGMGGQVLVQVIDSLALAPVHLVLHDSALFSGTNLVSVNAASVSSLTLVDSSPQSAAFPSALLSLPVVGDLLLSSKMAFAGLLRLCCARSVDGVDADAYRLVLKRKKRKKAVVAAGRALNHSFGVEEWADSEDVKRLPVQVLWSNTLSDQWIDEGHRVAAPIPHAKFSFHSGGRWPQEDAAEEISGMIADFVSSLPKSIRRIEEDIVPEHIQKMFDEARHHDHHHDHHHGHGQEHGYMGMYGLGHGL